MIRLVTAQCIKILVAFIKIYRIFISPLFPASCRFHPTCSIYSIKALEKYGFLKGIYLTVKRLLRCNPLCEGGYDPVP